MALARAALGPYGAGTAGMQVAPEASSLAEGASEAFVGVPVLPAAACLDQVGLEWVPDVEQPLVPEPLHRLCSGCPGRAGCLQWAISSRSVGYWAGTTTADRRQLLDKSSSNSPDRTGRAGVVRAEELQAAARARAAQHDAQDEQLARHLVGQDSLWWYRRGGCRCRRCRAHHALRRRQERARTRRGTAQPDLPGPAEPGACDSARQLAEGRGAS